MATNPANDLLVRAVMTAESGLPEDAVVNDFAFHNDTGFADADLPGVAAGVDAFYNSTQANGFKVAEWLSSQIDRGVTHELLIYRIQVDGSLSTPVYISPWLGPDTPTSTNGLPTECAGVLSFHADLSGVVEEAGSTRPRARRRGRIYVGPLVPEAVDEGTPPFYLTPNFTQTLRQAAVFLAEINSGAWSVWSRADGTLRSIVGGWTDNAPDTQRRRGPESSARITWSYTP